LQKKKFFFNKNFKKKNTYVKKNVKRKKKSQPSYKIGYSHENKINKVVFLFIHITMLLNFTYTHAPIYPKTERGNLKNGLWKLNFFTLKSRIKKLKKKVIFQICFSLSRKQNEIKRKNYIFFYLHMTMPICFRFLFFSHALACMKKKDSKQVSNNICKKNLKIIILEKKNFFKTQSRIVSNRQTIRYLQIK